MILDKDLTTITKDGRDAVMEDPEGDGFPWHPKPPAPIRDLAKPKGIDEAPSIVVYLETLPKADQDRILAELEPLATKYRDAAWEKREDPEFCFFAARNSEGPVSRVRQMTGQEALPPTKHKHELKKMDTTSGAWGCDGCNKPGHACKERFRCTEGCDFDFCEVCNEKAGATLESKPATAVLLNLDDDGAYYSLEGAVTAAAVEQFIADFKADSLIRKEVEG